LNSLAQDTGREAGFRGGVTSGLTYRQYLEHNFSYEGILSFRQDGLQFTLLRQIHEQSFFDVSDNLFFVYGYGAHAGFFYSRDYKMFVRNHVYYRERRFSPVFGIDGFGSVEYRMTTLPLSFALDFKPFFEVSVYQFFKINIWDLGLSVKYRF
jgi:hypothetical protein